ncbi:hypothetical protein GRI89_16770 [Altererythrobacter salegens]|uniref:Uncharacterized protein n=1 Tax=Croceibacterium salegens TaxID=1737568 RepID=A0A6I4T0S2_9SPHN|nr:hypothetical protein [Croceibacterium salegens]MXO61199.1 hypothetical protein [Croceibacterium salegens]
MVRWIATLAALLVAPAAWAEDADYYRGGWRAADGPPQVFEFVIVGAQVHGVYCTYCSDGTTLARIEGSFVEDDGIAFTVRHLDLAGNLVSQDRLTGKLEGRKLRVTGTRGADGATIDLVTIKDPRGPAPATIPQIILPPGSPPVKVLERRGGAAPPPPAPYVQAAPWKQQLSPKDLLGVWLGFGYGEPKQYFFIRNDGDELFGMACGPCDNPYTMGVLDNFAFDGDIVRFDIQHQDWGEGSKVPFVRNLAAHIGMNELRMDARRDDAPDRPGIVASLVGPLALEATAGNVNAAD